MSLTDHHLFWGAHAWNAIHLVTVKFNSPGSYSLTLRQAPKQFLLFENLIRASDSLKAPYTQIFYTLSGGSQASLPPVLSLEQCFSTSAILALWIKSFFVAGICPLHSRMLSSIPGLYTPDANGPPSTSCENQKCLQTSFNVPWGRKLAQWRTSFPERHLTVSALTPWTMHGGSSFKSRQVLCTCPAQTLGYQSVQQLN